MNPTNPETKQPAQNEQVQNQAIPPEAAKVEEAPVIKSEENKTNWKQFREQRDAERKAAEEANKRALEKAAEAEALKAALEALTNKPVQNRQPIHEGFHDDSDETDEQRIDKIVEAKFKKKEQEEARLRQQKDKEELPHRIAAVYNDFDKVVTDENIDYLNYHYPEIAAAYRYMPENFENLAYLYKTIKRFVPNPNAKQDQIKAEKNLQKPASISTPGNTQGGNAMPSARLDEARKAANWERMQRALKGVSS